ncbi:pro-sigmaK processing inhibitor BofA [Gottschalkia purinilytica]|uniref:Pro-sigmaK processing inhibitor BofA n=1 Tax=Gottschalkia purinilytica TaxID=1503 RepID=A0A0L0W8B9_GOTPU|nr:pro-sigmaK processing inhibitor BofA family protein [Gottschalkia purinilytica]KNF07510.1 pro-sigmaK processing inhibitor BofA [Gottschalkia purinilytica]
MAGVELSGIIAFGVGLVLLYLIGWLLVIPIKIIFKLIVNGIIGGIILFVINIVGSVVGISLGINPVTALVTGFLGVPGVILLLILKYLI